MKKTDDNQREDQRVVYGRTYWAPVLYVSLAVNMVSSLLLLTESYVALYLIEALSRYLALVAFLFAKVRKGNAACGAIWVMNIAYLILAGILSVLYCSFLWARAVPVGEAWGTFFSVSFTITRVADFLCAMSLFFLFENRERKPILFAAAWLCFAVYGILSALWNGYNFHLSVWEAPGVAVYILADVLYFVWFFLLSLCKEDKAIKMAVDLQPKELNGREE